MKTVTVVLAAAIAAGCATGGARPNAAEEAPRRLVVAPDTRGEAYYY